MRALLTFGSHDSTKIDSFLTGLIFSLILYANDVTNRVDQKKRHEGGFIYRTINMANKAH